MEFNHFDQAGNAIMVDVTGKEVTIRTAVAQGSISVCPEIIKAIKNGSSKKGDVLGVARVAGIMAAKRSSDLIPMCHPLFLNKCSVDFEVDDDNNTVTAVCMVRTEGKTGVEMEALTGVSLALLTIYDMCKSIDKRMCIENIHLVTKQGGKSGDFSYDSEPEA
ncbi:MAG: cyclic pyranopterin monophosphate synthase MoaC [Oscillospiraceae bacterium]|nr:cyclic pyranopterin monophosphate synthase MoaC [Oscillospiraceae bacterium]